ncbi:MAG: hypothetical protein ACR2FO_04940 [Actinomycetota bacterium]
MFFCAALSFLVPLITVGLIVIGVAGMAGGRDKDTERSGRRPFAGYVCSVTFVTLFTALFGVFALATALTRLAVGVEESGGCVEGPGFVRCSSMGAASSRVQAPVARPDSGTASDPSFQQTQPDGSLPSGSAHPAPIPDSPQPRARAIPEGEPAPPSNFVELSGRGRQERNEQIRQAVVAGLAVAAAVLVLLLHLRRIRELMVESSFSGNGNGARRIYHVYLYAAAFVAVLILLVSGVTAAYGLFRIVAPSATRLGFETIASERAQGLIQLIPSSLLAVGAGAIFVLHWRRAADTRETTPFPG